MHRIYIWQDQEGLNHIAMILFRKVYRKISMKKIGIILNAILVVVLTSYPGRAESPWIEKSKKEGKVLLYSTMQIPQMRVLMKSFEKKYPFLKVTQYRSNSDKLVQKILTETNAGRHLADVYQIRGTRMLRLQGKGALSHYESPERKDIRDIYKDKDGYWTGIYANMEFIGYNKNLVSYQEVPKSHKDLLDPKWKGNIGMDSSDVEWFITQFHILGEAKGREFMHQFAQQNIQFRRGHTLLTQLLTAGEFQIIMTLRGNTAYNYIKNGAPIGWVAFDPVIPNPANAVALPQKPPHPNAARLFIDYTLSREGQEVMRSLGRNPTRVDVHSLLPGIKELKLGKIDWSTYVKRYNDYEKEFREIFLK